MATLGTIRIGLNNITEFTSVVAGLTRENLVFTVRMTNTEWLIEITGH